MSNYNTPYQTKEQYDKIINKEQVDTCKINDNITHKLITTVSSIFVIMSRLWFTVWVKPSLDLLNFWNKEK